MEKIVKNIMVIGISLMMSLMLFVSINLNSLAHTLVNIDNQSAFINSKKANEIWDLVNSIIQKSYEGIYEFCNFNIIINDVSNDVSNEDNIIINIDVLVEMTLIRNPELSPIVIGMKKAADEIESRHKREMANVLIQEYLNEVMPYFNIPILTGFSYQIHMPVENIRTIGDVQNCMIYHRVDITEDEILLTQIENDISFVELGQENDGRVILMEALMDSPNVTTRTSPYDRNAAVYYAGFR